MRFLLPLLFAFGMNAHGAHIKWTSADECFDPGFVVCGSFFFDADSGNYSFIDLLFTINDQGFNWTAEYFIDTFSGSSDLIPSFVPLPIPTPTTLPLVFSALAGLAWWRRKAGR